MTLGGWVFLALGWGGTLWLSYFAYRKLLTKKAGGKGEGPNMFPTA